MQRIQKLLLILVVILLGQGFFIQNTWVTKAAAQDLQDSEEAQAHMQKGISLYQQGQYAAALAEVQIVAEKYPSYAVAYRVVGLCQLQLKQYEKAVDSLKKANQLSLEQEKREDQAARIALGRAFFYAGKYTEAIPELTYAIKQKPNDASGYYFLGFANYRTNQEAEAVANLSQAVSLNDKDTASWRVLAEIYLSRFANHPEDKVITTKAVQAAQKLKSLDNSPESADVLGRAYLATRQFFKAIPEFEQAAAAQPQNGLVQFNLGLVYSRSDQFSKAIPVLVKATELVPNSVDVLRELGYVYEKDKKPAKALEVYEKANQLTNGQDEYFKNALERVRQQTK